MQLQQKLDQLSKVNKSKSGITTVIFFIEYFCLHGILPFSKSCLETGSPWPTAKCRHKKSFDTWYYIAICATLCVSFWWKLKATNAFSKTYSEIESTWSTNSSKSLKKNFFEKKILPAYLCAYDLQNRVRFGGNYLTNHLVKFLQDRIKPWRVGALRVCTGSQSYSGCASPVIFKDGGQKGPPP